MLYVVALIDLVIHGAEPEDSCTSPRGRCGHNVLLKTDSVVERKGDASSNDTVYFGSSPPVSRYLTTPSSRVGVFSVGELAKVYYYLVNREQTFWIDDGHPNLKRRAFECDNDS